jgi:hypothetical protein
MRLAQLLVLALVCALPLELPAFTANEDIVVHVRKEGGGVSIDVVCPVDAPWQIVMGSADRLSAHAAIHLEHPRKRRRAAERERSARAAEGKASRGPVTLSYEMLREVELVPQSEIRSRLISGDLKSSDFVTKIVQSGDRITIVNNGHYVPKLWVPPVVGPAMIEAETQKQFGEFRAEILRRSATARPQS